MKPPPQNPPPTVPQSFLTAVASLTWGGNHLVVTGTDGARYPTVRGTSPGAWALVTSPGLSLTEATYLSLKGGNANADGSYTDAVGETWFMRQAGGWAILSTT